MNATSFTGPTLASRQPTAARTDPRLALRRLRVAMAAVITAAPEPTHPWYDLTRTDPRAPLPCEKERAMLHAAIRQGRTTPDRLLSYYVARLQDDLAQFAEPVALSDVLYVRLMAEEAEALEAQAKARGLGTEEAKEEAIRETSNEIAIAELYIAQQRSTLPSHPVPMGVR